ncbi:hypothetical protein [Motiliproteus sp. SC1-56]|uniref:hypothetical protein n=1 Tax=Motiliproteus sp. SC1-56 TaxID=2799565 RepID=UPI001A905EDF|nr:hypothetical protein [Motiliproteus sp. SC1-56]
MTRVLLVLALLLAAQAPLAWQAYEKTRQCEGSVAKQASSKLASLAVELDVVDCAFSRYYRAAWQQLLEG